MYLLCFDKIGNIKAGDFVWIDEHDIAYLIDKTKEIHGYVKMGRAITNSDGNGRVFIDIGVNIINTKCMRSIDKG